MLRLHEVKTCPREYNSRGCVFLRRVKAVLLFSSKRARVCRSTIRHAVSKSAVLQ